MQKNNFTRQCAIDGFSLLGYDNRKWSGCPHAREANNPSLYGNFENSIKLS